MVPKFEICLILLQFASLDHFALAEPQVPCYFIFGDSAVDNGNNIGLNTLAKADFRPYEIDLPAGMPTGRFTNGRTATDLLGLKVLEKPCCTLLTGLVGVCVPRQDPCDDRDTHVFWDGYHTSEAVNMVIANKSYYAIAPDGVHPMNIAQLAQLE